MEGSIVFYTYGSTLELYGQQFTAGMLTADLLNLSPDEYRPMSKRMKQVTSLAEEYEQSGRKTRTLSSLSYGRSRGSSICFQKRSISRQRKYNGNGLSAWRMKSPRAVKRSRMLHSTCSIRAKQL